METEKRRDALRNLLRKESAPLTGGDLAGRFSVSRQVIVQDIAILRAAGEQILATPQGYLILKEQGQTAVRSVLACRHTREQIEDEIGLVVDMGGKVLDVIVEHPVYGELRGNLMIANRRDLSLFLDQVNKTEARPLAELTDGLHLHTIEAPDEKVMDEICAVLRKSGFLIS